MLFRSRGCLPAASVIPGGHKSQSDHIKTNIRECLPRSFILTNTWMGRHLLRNIARCQLHFCGSPNSAYAAYPTHVCVWGACTLTLWKLQISQALARVLRLPCGPCVNMSALETCIRHKQRPHILAYSPWMRSLFETRTQRRDTIETSLLCFLEAHGGAERTCGFPPPDGQIHVSEVNWFLENCPIYFPKY